MSIQNVAKQAGVSTATVSRVINNLPGVGDKTRARVKQCMVDLDYVVRAVRPGPRPQKHQQPGVVTGAIGLLFIGQHLDILTHPLINRLVVCLGEALREYGLSLVLEHAEDVEAAKVLAKSQRIDVALTMPSNDLMEESLLELSKCLPTIHILGDEHYVPNVDHITVDNNLIGEVAFSALTELGLKELYFLNLEAYFHASHTNRARSFSDVACLRNKTRPHICIVEGEGQELRSFYPQPCTVQPTGAELVPELLGKVARPFGLFIPAVDQLLQVSQMLTAAGVDVDHEVKFVTVGNIPSMIPAGIPAPIIIDLNLNTVAGQAVRLLLDRLARPSAEAITIRVPPRVVEAGHLDDALQVGKSFRI